MLSLARSFAIQLSESSSGAVWDMVEMVDVADVVFRSLTAVAVRFESLLIQLSAGPRVTVTPAGSSAAAAAAAPALLPAMALLPEGAAGLSASGVLLYRRLSHAGTLSSFSLSVPAMGDIWLRVAINALLSELRCDSLRCFLGLEKRSAAPGEEGLLAGSLSRDAAPDAPDVLLRENLSIQLVLLMLAPAPASERLVGEASRLLGTGLLASCFCSSLSSQETSDCAAWMATCCCSAYVAAL